MTEAYPLHWPAGWPRTRSPQRSRFDVTFEKARQELVWEIERMGGRYPVISTNIALRRDGYPYASAKAPDDPGVAVYFQKGEKQMVFACDRWDLVKDNIRAITKTIEALRGIERWGASDMMERAFSAFEALPPPTDWRDTFKGCRTADDVQREFRRKAKECHPDNGGNASAFARLTEHYEQAKRDMASA